MVQITTDVSALSPLQRQQLSSFILTFGIIEKSAALVEALADFEHKIATGEIIPNDIDAEAAFGCPVIAPPPPQHADASLSMPVATVSTPAPQLLSSVPVDKSGATWDANLHASSKAVTADGMWRKKRGVGDTAAEAFRTPADSVISAPLPPSGAPVTATPADYVTLIGIASAAVASGKLTLDEVAAAAVNAGVKAPEGVSPLQGLSGRLDLVATVTAEVNRIIASRAA